MSSTLAPPHLDDTNARIAACLYDLAYAQASPQSRWGYKRAAAVVRRLDVPIGSLVNADGSLQRVYGLGPASTRIVLEVLRTGTSETADRAVAASGRADDIERRRGLRGHFLSRARVLEVLAASPFTGESHYRGDLQMHSTWSDGGEPIAELVKGCLARGYEYCGITDHSYGLPIARGMSMASLASQHEEIGELNRQYAGRFRVIKSIEANILVDGRLDMTTSDRRRLELVVAAPHSKLRVAEDQTARMLGAVATPGVGILAHPRGRIYGSRAGVQADWDVVFAAAARAGVAVEIDGDPSRQDLDYPLARQALDAGCLFALDSDGHSVSDLVFADTAMAHATLAGIPPERVVNTWPIDRLLEWAAQAWRR